MTGLPVAQETPRQFALFPSSLLPPADQRRRPRPGARPRPVPQPLAATPPCDGTAYALLLPRTLTEQAEALASHRHTDLAGLIRAALILSDEDGPGASSDENTLAPLARVLILPAGLTTGRITAALRLAVRLSQPDYWQLIDRQAHKREEAQRQGDLLALANKLDAAAASVEKLAFTPVPGGVRTPRQAAYVLGILDEDQTSEAEITRRFRLLAPHYHPDTGLLTGSERMTQLIEARRILVAHLRQLRG